MAWENYNHMWDKAQREGKYRLFLFDLKGSRKHYYDGDDMYQNLRNLLDSVYGKIKELEKIRGYKILHTSKYLDGKRGDTIEPVVFMGDLMVFTTLRGRISSKEVYRIFTESKKELNLTRYQFHFANGYYETDKYVEGDQKYFRGYCMGYLNHIAKQKKCLL